MQKRKFICEKYWLKDDEPPMRLIISEKVEGRKEVMDIYTLYSDEQADEWLKTVWGVGPSPNEGEQLEFESFGPVEV
jgi:hypothetical protein